MSTLKRYTGSAWETIGLPNNVGMSPQTLGYAQVTTYQTGIGTGGADLAGLAVTVTVPAGRRLRVTGHAIFQKLTAAGWVNLEIKQNGVAINEDLNRFDSFGATSFWTAHAAAIVSPSAGTHTFKLTATAETNTADLVAAATFPAYILVEDITGSTLPYQPASVPVGQLGYSEITSNVASASGVETILPMSVNIVVPAGRTIRIRSFITMTNSAANSQNWTGIKEGATVLKFALMNMPLAGNQITMINEHVFSPSAGAHTYTVGIQSNSGTFTAYADADRRTFMTVEDITPTPAPSSGAPGSTLGYAEVLASQAGITTETDLNGLTATVTVPAGRRLRITVGGEISRTVADGRSRISIKEGATLLQVVDTFVTDTVGANTFQKSVVVSPSAGAHTYKATLTLTSGTGSTGLAAGASLPAFILVEDITGSVWPQGSAVTAGMVASEAWTAYTPANGNVTVGNGTQAASYARVGRTIHVRYDLLFGSSTAFTGATVGIGLPVAAAAGVHQTLSASLLDVSAGFFVGTLVIGFDNATQGRLIHAVPGSNTGNTGTSWPFAWAAGDRVSVAGTYEAAS